MEIAFHDLPDLPDQPPFTVTTPSFVSSLPYTPTNMLVDEQYVESSHPGDEKHVESSLPVHEVHHHPLDVVNPPVHHSVVTPKKKDARKPKVPKQHAASRKKNPDRPLLSRSLKCRYAALIDSHVSKPAGDDPLFDAFQLACIECLEKHPSLSSGHVMVSWRDLCEKRASSEEYRTLSQLMLRNLKRHQKAQQAVKSLSSQLL
jgi:hypothetical protein